MITTRDMSVPLHADLRIFHYKLQLRSTDESWTLFENSLGMDNVPQELENLGREIVMSCSGLPLAIVNKGKLLSEKGQNNEEWSRLLNKEDTEPWSEIFKKASRELPLELKVCLHYFLLFPEEFEIPARRLITLWVAEAF